MEISLKSYSQKDLGTVILGKNALSIRNDGVFAFTVALTQELKLDAGIHVLFSNNENSPKEWFVSISDDGLPLRKMQNVNRNSVCFTSKALRRVMLKSLGLDRSKSYSCIVSITPTVINGKEYYSLLTSSIK